MSSWKEWVKANDWSTVTNRMLFLPAEEQYDLLGELKRIVPQIEDRNGVEVGAVRFVGPDEAPPHLVGAAKILALGELEAFVDGLPADDIDTWKSIRGETEQTLRELKTLPEVTEGSGSMSRSKHAKDGLDHLRSLDFALHHSLGQFTSTAERRLVEELVAAVAWHAFTAGRHTQLALYKPIETSAIRGDKVIGGSRNSAQEANRKHAVLRELRLTRMRELVPLMGVSKAAATCEAEGLGPRESIRQQWYRWKKRNS